MKINVTKKSRRLETISIEDILIFPDREEEVREIYITTGTLYTQRKVKTKDKGSFLNPKNFPFKKEFVMYDRIEKIFPDSEGSVYDYTYIKKENCIK